MPNDFTTKYIFFPGENASFILIELLIWSVNTFKWKGIVLSYIPNTNRDVTILWHEYYTALQAPDSKSCITPRTDLMCDRAYLTFRLMNIKFYVEMSVHTVFHLSNLDEILFSVHLFLSHTCTYSYTQTCRLTLDRVNLRGCRGFPSTSANRFLIATAKVPFIFDVVVVICLWIEISAAQ